MLRMHLTVVALAIRAAHSWQPVGVWEHVVGAEINGAGPSGRLTPNGLVHESGALYSIAQADSASPVSTFILDLAGMSWSQTNGKGGEASPQHLHSIAGLLLAVGGANGEIFGADVLYQAVSSVVNGTWTTLPMANAAPLDGAATCVYGGRLISAGGLVRGDMPMFTNALMATDFGRFIAADPRPAQLGWAVLTPSGGSAWSPRAGASLSVWGDTVVLYGGLTFAATSGSPPVAGNNVCTSADAGCRTLTDVWMWQPGAPTGPLAPCDGPGGDCGWWQEATVGEPGPVGRYNHAASVLGDILYVLGGVTDKGAILSELWAYHMTHGMWRPVETTVSVGHPCQRSPR